MKVGLTYFCVLLICNCYAFSVVPKSVNGLKVSIFSAIEFPSFFHVKIKVLINQVLTYLCRISVLFGKR